MSVTSRFCWINGFGSVSFHAGCRSRHGKFAMELGSMRISLMLLEVSNLEPTSTFGDVLSPSGHSRILILTMTENPTSDLSAPAYESVPECHAGIPGGPSPIGEIDLVESRAAPSEMLASTKLLEPSQAWQPVADGEDRSLLQPTKSNIMGTKGIHL